MTNEARPHADKILKPQIQQITHKNLTIYEDKSQNASPPDILLGWPSSYIQYSFGSSKGLFSMGLSTASFISDYFFKISMGKTNEYNISEFISCHK